MPDLNNQEQKIFEDPEKIKELLFHPLMQFVRADLKDAKALEQLGDPKVFDPVSSQAIDNSNQANWRYNLDIDSFKKHPQDNEASDGEDYQSEPEHKVNRSFFTLNSEARRYLLALLTAFEDDSDRRTNQ